MKKIIYNMRQQPEEVRRHILHMTTAVFAVILFLLWVVSLGRNFGAEEKRAEIKDSIEPFSALKANLIDGYYSLTQ